MSRWCAASPAALHMPGGERDDLDQEARIGILQAIRD
jgi:hypothetical protein